MIQPVRKRILFVDGDERVRRFCAEVLSTAGYAVELASSGTEAYGKLRESQFDLVITDLRTKGLDGIGLYLNTLKIYSNMKEKFLFMTGDACSDYESQSVIVRLNEKYLVKPFGTNEFLQKVERLTGSNLLSYLMRSRNLGENRREEKRYCWAEDCRITEDSRDARPFTQTSDISRHGLRVRYMGSPLEPDGIVKVALRDLGVRTLARIIWSKGIDEREAVSGIKLSEAISAAALSSILQNRRAFIPPLVSNRD